MKIDTMDKINLIIKKRLNQHKLGDSAKAAQVLGQVNNLLHDELKCSDREIKALRLKDGTLYIGTAGAGWSQEVFLRREQLIEDVCKRHGAKTATKIIIKSLTAW